ncbi:UNVERIFIED_CONTAM: hypothetical protein FKN15_022300 [Acipenser sinensis]
MEQENIFLFVPNLIGYSRILFAFISFYFMPTCPLLASVFYLLSGFLDAFDGHAARLLNQGTQFGAMLDMLTDRCATMCLLVNLSLLYPQYTILFQLSMTIDVASHWIHLHSPAVSNGSVFLLSGIQFGKMLMHCGGCSPAVSNGSVFLLSGIQFGKMLMHCGGCSPAVSNGSVFPLSGTQFGAMLDMLTDRCATMCLLVNLSLLYPQYTILFQLSMTIDPVLFVMCAGNELFYCMLYLLNFYEGPTVGFLPAGLFRCVFWLSVPIAVLKLGISLLHLVTASRNIAAIDTAERKKKLDAGNVPIAVLKLGISLLHLVTASRNIAAIDTAERKKKLDAGK